MHIQIFWSLSFPFIFLRSGDVEPRFTGHAWVRGGVSERVSECPVGFSLSLSLSLFVCVCARLLCVCVVSCVYVCE